MIIKIKSEELLAEAERFVAEHPEYIIKSD